jgi:hypothetical protein
LIKQEQLCFLLNSNYIEEIKMQTIKNKTLTIMAIVLLASSVFTVMTNISTEAQHATQMVSGPLS